ncbi:hypothetical protein BD560DRAFT_341537, partial [Blakeslea trispora]
YTDFHGWGPEKSCLFATTLLRDRADAWYRTLEVSNDTPSTWLEFKRLLIDFSDQTTLFALLVTS